MLFVLFGLLGVGLAASLIDLSDGDSGTTDEMDDDSTTTDDSTSEGTDMISSLFGDDGDNEISVDENLTDDVRVISEGGNDTIQTGAGDDTVFSGSGNDNVKSGDGNDRVFLSSGEDFWSDLAGQNDPDFGGDDFVRGGAGSDQLISLGGSDTLYGDTGNDVLSSEEILTQFSGGGAHADEVFGGFGNDSIFADDGDTVTGGEGEDTISVNLDPGVGFGQSQNASEDWSPVEVTDFNPAEDILEFQLPFGVTETGETLSYVGTDGEEITLTYGQFELATLRNVFFNDVEERVFLS